MRTLWLTRAQAETIGRHALAERPDEACGIIGGREGRVERILPVTNIAPDPREHYTLDHTELGRALLAFERDGLDLIAFYHSHPHSDPIPSRTDVALATYPDTPYLIVGLHSGDPEFAAWRLAGGDAERVPLHIGEAPPVEDEDALSRAQKAAIIISAALALVVMLVVSLSLLPPAPELPVR